MTAVAYLQKALDLIRDPGRWTTGEYARDVDGGPASKHGENAVRWCAWGGFQKVCRMFEELNWEEQDRAEDVLREVAAGKIHPSIDPEDIGNPVTYVNDAYGHDAVVAVFAEAIRRLGEGEHA